LKLKAVANSDKIKRILGGSLLDIEEAIRRVIDQIRKAEERVGPNIQFIIDEKTSMRRDEWKEFWELRFATETRLWTETFTTFVEDIGNTVITIQSWLKNLTDLVMGDVSEYHSAVDHIKRTIRENFDRIKKDQEKWRSATLTEIRLLRVELSDMNQAGDGNTCDDRMKHIRGNFQGFSGFLESCRVTFRGIREILYREDHFIIPELEELIQKQKEERAAKRTHSQAFSTEDRWRSSAPSTSSAPSSRGRSLARGGGGGAGR
jgi:ribosomal protein L20